MTARPLYSVEAEQSVIGALLLANDAYDSIADIVSEPDFWGEGHRVLFRHVANLLRDGKQADATTLIASLSAADDIDKIGGVAYLEAILLAVPSARGIVQYARTVVDHRLERDLAAAAVTMDELARGAGPVAERMAEAQSTIFALAETTNDNDPTSIRDALGEFVEDLEARIELGGEISGLSTGLADLDGVLDGLQGGDLIILGGRPSMGKSALACQIGDDAALAGKSVLVFSMEMSKKQLAQRSISRIGRINSHELRSGKLVDGSWERLSSAMGRLHDRKLYIDDSSAISVERMRARARRHKRKHGLDLVIIDYLQLMTGGGDTRNEELSGITRSLKGMARELGVPVVLLSQLSRKCEERGDKRPLMSDLRESGAIEQDADVILFIYRDEVYNDNTPDKGMAEVIISKCRMGATGKVRLTWVGEFTSFENYAGGAHVVPIEQARSRGRRSTFEV